MDILERIWELIGLFFSGLLRGFERANHRPVRLVQRPLHPEAPARVEAINAWSRSTRR